MKYSINSIEDFSAFRDYKDHVECKLRPNIIIKSQIRLGITLKVWALLCLQ